jgi:hypothetical protein
MPLKPKLISKLCEICGTSDDDKFTPYIYTICKSCKREKNKKEHLCKYCAESKEEKFYEGRYNVCKPCFSSKVNNKRKDEKLSEEVDNSNELTKIDVKKVVRKFLHLDYELFEGLTLKQAIEEIKTENVELNTKLEKANLEIESLNNKIKSMSDEFTKLENRMEEKLIKFSK